MTFSACAYLRTSSIARVRGTGMPLDIVHVSGLWQKRQRNMHAVVHATKRTPGPSTAEPVVKECRKPTSPDAIAALTSTSGTSFPRSTRSSYGDLASSGVAVVISFISITVKSAIDDIKLLLA